MDSPEKKGIKDLWDKIQLISTIVSSVLIPLTIAFVGWYYTDQHNRSQIQIQKDNNDSQLELAIINSNVGQSELIKDFMQHLTSSDSSVRNIAIEAVLYAAPAPWKRIVDIISRSGTNKEKLVAINALSAKRTDLINNLFSSQKANRLIAANEIIANWTMDRFLLEELITRSNDCLSNKDITGDCENGIYNSVVVLNGFSKELLQDYKNQINSMIKLIPGNNRKTLAQAADLLRKVT